MLLLALTLSVMGCAAADDVGPVPLDAGLSDSSTSGDTGERGDASVDGTTSPADSGAPELPGEAIAAGTFPGGATADFAEDPSRFGPDDPRTCWDGSDNDGDSEQDCDDESCRAVPACGLGSGTRCDAESSLAFLASSCADSPATPTCLGATERAFGSPAPWVAGDRLHPGGDDFDSGLVVAEALEPASRRIVMTATLAAATCPMGELCVETASFGITTMTSFGATTRVTAAAALQLSTSRNQVTLVVGGAVVTQWPFDAMSPEWTLDLRPTGEIVVRRGDETLIHSPYAPPASATAAIWGRNTNRAESEPGGAGIEAFSLDTQVCDIPDAWQSRDAVTLTDPGGVPFVPVGVRGPSLARGGDGILYLAFEARGASGQGRILVASEDGDPARFRLEHPAASQVLAPSDVGDVERVGDPELHWDDAESTWHLFFTGDFGGERRVGHASGASLTTLTFSGWVASPAGNVSAVDMPSVTRSADGRFILAARLAKEGGHAIGIYVGSDPTMPFTRHAGVLETDTLRDGTADSGFDADEIGSPSIRVVDAAYHLYFAGRRGTRWGIGVWTSGELVYWRHVSATAAILGGDGDGFDRLGVRDPEILAEGAETRLYYVGGDGESERLGVASRPRPEFLP
jgi:hypothetical protein